MPPADEPPVDPLVARSLALAIDAARARWPGISVDEAALAQLLAERGEGEPAFLVDLVLAQACLAGDTLAIRHFDREMLARVDGVLARLRMTAADADDLKQELRAKLLLGDGAKLSQFQGTGPLVQWVASVAGREALGLLRKRKLVDPLGDDDLLDTADDPQLNVLKERHSSDFKRAFQAAVAELPARDRGVLRAMIIDDRSINEIAAVYGIHRVTASRWVSEIRHALLSGTRAHLRRQLALDESSLDSAIRLIDTNLEVSLHRLLGDAA
jgi:RNA polymerase sigma-70 factor, ECF subfamily